MDNIKEILDPVLGEKVIKNGEINWPGLYIFAPSSTPLLPLTGKL